MIKYDIRSMVTNPLMNTSHISRYSGVKLVEPEMLDTHLINVMMLGSMLIDELNESHHESLSEGVFLEKALHHDADEALTGDVTRTLKYHNEAVHKELQNVADEVASSMYSKYFNNPNYYYYLWDNAKHGKEGGILKIVDMLDVAIKALREVELLNNMYALRIIYEVKFYLNETIIDFLENHSPYNEEATEFLLVYVENTVSILEEVWDKYKDTADHYRIIDTTIFSEGDPV